MPYCPKCGVKVKNGRNDCPLCEYYVPTIVDEPIEEGRYPLQENAYNLLARKKRNMFYSIYIILSVALSINLILIDLSDGYLHWSLYSAIYIIGSIVYLLPFLRYIKSIYTNLSIIAINTCILLFLTALVNKNLSWFFELGLPITVISFIFLLLVLKIVLNKYILPHKLIYILIIIGVYTIALEFLIDKYLYNSINLLWSVQICIFLVPLIMLIAFIPKKFYDKIIENIKIKFHI